jgi:hypothetical protein
LASAAPVRALDAVELDLEAGSGIPEREDLALARHGNLLVATGRPDEAEGVLRRALRLVPGICARPGDDPDALAAKLAG